ncbi:PH domain-containing protein [Mycolicibacterium sp. 3033]|nr:PH domain-containing protein [Mycolicibacterium aurantiacum]
MSDGGGWRQCPDTGKKRDYSSLPYSKIQAWSLETAGKFEWDAASG